MQNPKTAIKPQVNDQNRSIWVLEKLALGVHPTSLGPLLIWLRFYGHINILQFFAMLFWTLS